MRDGRDVMVSFYYHSLFKNERFNAKLVEMTRKEVSFKDFDNINKNLSAFIEYKFTCKTPPDLHGVNLSIIGWTKRSLL
jgi:hypothetical protein